MRLASCLCGTALAVVVLSTGVSRLERSTATVKTSAQQASASLATLSEESLYQLGSTWTNDRGEPLRLVALAGAPEVVAMVYTRCTSLCPTLVHDLKSMDRRMHGGARSRTRYVLVTMDPEHDTPAALAAYRRHMGLEDDRWMLLRGSDSDTRELAAVLGFAYGRGDGKNYSHSSLVTVLDPGGRIAHQQTSVGADPQRTIAAIEGLLAR